MHLKSNACGLRNWNKSGNLDKVQTVPYGSSSRGTSSCACDYGRFGATEAADTADRLADTAAAYTYSIKAHVCTAMVHAVNK